MIHTQRVDILHWMPRIVHQRINVLLPSPTLRLLDQVAPRGRRSELIDEAVRYFLHAKGRTEVRRLLRDGARSRADRDQRLAEVWFSLAERG